MNIIRMTGGIGNQMFTYALYLKFKSLGIECYIDDFSEYEGHDNARPLRLSVFDIEYPRVPRDLYNEYTDSNMDIFSRIRRKVCGRKSKAYEEASLNFDPEILKLDGKYIMGYFQSEKYFADIKEKVLEAYTFNTEAKREATKIIGKSGLTAFLETNPASKSVFKENMISLHIRRGDYMLLPDTYGEICNEEYYDRSVRYMMENVSDAEFIIFTNDEEWTADWIRRYSKENPSSEGRLHIFSGTTEEQGYLDMYVMSQCTHHIIANSSFSWWGAYIGVNPSKKIIAPKIWNRTTEQRDIYTDKMILM